MYNLHAHTFLSDGELLPSEVAVRYQDKGYTVIAITDHADYSNIKQIAKSVVEFCRRWPKNSGIKVLPGIELTHLPPEQFKPLASLARKEGIKIIIAHGETPVEPVTKDTNRLSLLADIDILAHPGLISDSDTQLASQRGIFLEITSRRGHNQANAHVIKQARKFGAKLILNNDSHTPEDIITPEQLIQVGLDSGLTPGEIDTIYEDVKKFLNKKKL
ncbi:MAG: histidinol phosphate phosphatase domain-containing protein [Candidatus Omnitrophica bacterium]|nr:histidinol phosphate phosphatase domain-containing protein [Candidatus Omnitrophota bacterium]MBU4303713.1 histidinol phosphate phosphatase domain-containing protein [Candidatus Omnitrophota bacterium]MBU4419279.1 histidinol phosphate phosphatase domain-containing protein [Candidatus Omnitrophota bacterium]MBU4467631.1 histidinol phosphate phosphatase domain-containing protein [Candidatus Omnitrophota bacterium]MCG2707699.1 histidinol phosphate phosphatase domain-containing protein [Candidat